MTEDKAAPAQEAYQPGIVRRIGGFLLNVSLLVLGAFIISRVMESVFPVGYAANDVIGARQFLSSTASVCATLASFLLASSAFVASSRGSAGFVSLLKRGDFDIPMLGLAIVFLIAQALFCLHDLATLTNPGSLDEGELVAIVDNTMNNTVLAITVLMLAIWSSAAPKAVNAVVYGIGKVKT